MMDTQLAQPYLSCWSSIRACICMCVDGAGAVAQLHTTCTTISKLLEQLESMLVCRVNTAVIMIALHDLVCICLG